ncbi:MAG: NAD-dependent DNA ligase LigA [Spirochaetales bacterium]|nr:NAD-dependent DNA ligase LigA [Spirochaetales bacterium]
MTHEEARREIRELSSLLRRYNYEYHITNKPLVSDLEYDRVFDKLRDIEKSFPDLIEQDSPSRRVGSDLRGDLPEAEHSVPVLSLDKAYTADAIMTWIEKTVRNAGQELTFVIEEKIDGVSIVLYYENGRLVRAITRGNGYVGNDVTANLMTVRSVPLRLNKDVTLAVRGEIYLPVDKFDDLNKQMETPYANPRNLAAGSIRRIRSSEVAGIPLEIFTYEGYMENASTHLENLEILRELGFRLNPRIGFFSKSGVLLAAKSSGMFTGSFDQIEEYIRQKTLDRPGLTCEIDGLVLKVNEIPVRDALGYTGHHPRWEIAYKFEAPEGISTVNAVDVQVGRTGRITPVARISPVKIGGSVVSNVTLHNQDYVDMLELSVGDNVTVSKRGDVIPAIERVIDKNETGTATWKMPETCPSCSQNLSLKGAHHFCTNQDCPDQMRGRLYFFAAKGQMDIENLGPETIDVLVDKGFVSNIEDIYSCDYNLLQGVPGFGDKKIELVKAGVEESKSRPFGAVLTALGIPELGPKVAELLIKSGYNDIDLIFKLSDMEARDTLVEIDGIGEKTAEMLITELQRKDIRTSIAALRKCGLNFYAEPEHKTAGTLFENQIWCVTGSFEHYKPRETAMDEVKRQGGKTVLQVSGKTTHLLAGSGAGSKLTKAESLGVTVVSEKEFRKMIGDIE